MALTGTSLLVLLAVSTFAAPAGVWWLWPRVRGPRPVRAAQQVGGIVVAQVAAVLLVAVALNDYGQFYTSWSDLLGLTPPKVAAVKQYGHTGAAPVTPAPLAVVRPTAHTTSEPRPAADSVAGYPATSWSSPSAWSVNGAVVSVPVSGARTGYVQNAYVYLPPQWFTTAPSRRAFPLLEVFTGFPGHPDLLLTRLDYPRYVLDGIRLGELRPMVLVMMRPTVAFPRDTECLDIPRGPQSLTYFASDVPVAVATDFQFVVRGAGAVGDSSGGYCALRLAMTYPHTFTTAASLSGYYKPVSDFTTGDLYHGSVTARNQADLLWRLRNLPPPHVAVFVATSHSETGYEGYRAAQRFLKLIRPPMSAEQIVVAHGGHNFETWNLELPRALRFLSERLSPA